MIRLELDGGRQKEIVLYWEGAKEVFTDMDAYITSWYMGYLPKPGEWRMLRASCEELDIGEVKLKGISLVANAGKIQWGDTVVRDGKDGSERCLRENVKAN